MRVAPVVFALLICTALVATAELSAQERTEMLSESGNAFLRLCSAVEQSEKSTPLETIHSVDCLAYVQGFTEGMDAEVAWAQGWTQKGEQPQPFCRPEDVENGQLVRVILKYIRSHPEKAHKGTATLIVEALRQAFPCPSK
jgi:hypothetical protein